MTETTLLLVYSSTVSRGDTPVHLLIIILNEKIYACICQNYAISSFLLTVSGSELE